MKVALGADHGGVALKDVIKQQLLKDGYEVLDFGCDCSQSVDYPDYALPVGVSVQKGDAERGILVCGTGIGMSIAANKMTGIRCALLSDTFSARATREHNDTNIMAIGERVVGPGLALELVKIWLETPYSGEDRHQKRIDKITKIESESGR